MGEGDFQIYKKDWNFMNTIKTLTQKLCLQVGNLIIMIVIKIFQ